MRPLVIDPISKRASGAAPRTAVRVPSAVTAATASAGLAVPTTSRASAASSWSPAPVRGSVLGAGRTVAATASATAAHTASSAPGRDVHRSSSQKVVANATSSGTTRSAGTCTWPRPLARSQPAAVNVRMWW